MKKVIIEKIAKDLRKYIFKIVCKRGGHLSTAFSSIEILTTLYFTKILDINYKNYKKPNRNFFLLSKGHGETLLYAILVKKKKLLVMTSCKIITGVAPMNSGGI